MILNERQKEILEIIKKNSPISGEEISKKLKITKSALRTDFSILRGLNLIISKTKKGYFYNNKCTLNLVRDVMSKGNSIDVSISVYDAIIHLFKYDLGSLFVTDKKRLVGIISRKDLLKSVLNGKNIEKIPVSLIMTRMPNLIYCYEDDTIIEATKKLIEHEIDSIPVLKRDKGTLYVVGRFTKTNVTKLYFNKFNIKQDEEED